MINNSFAASLKANVYMYINKACEDCCRMYLKPGKICFLQNRGS